jgi:hypothetical protein
MYDLQTAVTVTVNGLVNFIMLMQKYISYLTHNCDNINFKRKY